MNLQWRLVLDKGSDQKADVETKAPGTSRQLYAVDMKAPLWVLMTKRSKYIEQK